MIQSIEALIPEGESVNEAVLLQDRPRWTIPAGVAVFLAALAAIGQAEWNAIVAYAIAGSLLGAVVGFGSQPYLIAGTSERVLLFKSAKMRASATELVEEIPAGVTLRRVQSLINDVYELQGMRLIGSRAFRDRLASIIPIRAS